MSRIDLSGARISRRSVLPSGCTKPMTVTSFGTSWAVIRGAVAAMRTATTANRLNNLLVVTTLDTVIGPKYTGARKRPATRCVAGSSIALAQPPAGRRGEPRVKKNRKLFAGAAFVAVLAALGVVQGYLDKVAAQAKQVPRFEVDPFWPKPMPNNWVFGQTIGLGISSDDHVWIIHRGNDPANLDRTELAHADRRTARVVSECCNPAPPVMEFDPAGNNVGGWGGPVAGAPYQWPESNHGIVVDHKGFVWIGGNGGPDSHILKFTRDGKFVAQYGKTGARKDPASPADKPVYRSNSLDMDNFGRVAKIFIDPKANEGYVSDGYLNKRVAVIDLDSGKIKRIWGAYGEPPTDAQPRTATIRPRRCRSSSATRCTAPKCRTTAWSTSATARTIASRCSRRKASSCKENSIDPQTRCRTARCGTSRSRRIRSSSSSTWPTAPTSTSASSTARR